MNSVCGGRGKRRFRFILLTRSFTRLAALLHELGNYAGPSGLMAGAYAGTGVAVEVLVKQDKVTPVGVGLKLFEVPEHRPAATLVLEEYVGHAARQLSRDFPQSHHLSRSGRKLDFEIIAEV